MANDILYVTKINEIQRELRNLKTAHFKTATTIETTTAEQTLNFTLEIAGLDVVSTKTAVLTMTSLDGSNMLSALYLKGATPDNLNDRFVFVNRRASGTGQAKFDVVVYSGNMDDWTTLEGGGTVNLSYTVQMVGSSRFSVSLSYKDTVVRE